MICSTCSREAPYSRWELTQRPTTGERGGRVGGREGERDREHIELSGWGCAKELEGTGEGEPGSEYIIWKNVFSLK